MGRLGVLAIRTRHSNAVPAEAQALLETFVSRIALVIEREFLDEAAERAAMLSESERLYSTLLNSISHELRTPISTIMGAASGLLEPAARVGGSARQTLSHDIYEAAGRLWKIVPWAGIHVVQEMFPTCRHRADRYHCQLA
jgi:two-component system, OmpR family, sensor histidine kinase KdpD